MHYLLFYDVAKDYPTKRVPFRSAHLEYAWQAVERGELVLRAHAMQRLERLLLDGLHGHGLHPATPRSFKQRFRVGAICFVPTDVRPHVLHR